MHKFKDKFCDTQQPSKKGNYSNQINIFKDKLTESVKLHLRSDVRVGSALSGGLDSSTVVCLVNNLLQKSGNSELQSTFSSVNPDPRYSDSEKRYTTQHNIKQDVSSTHRQPYPQEHEINLPRLKMSTEGMPFIDPKDHIMSIN